MPTTHVLIVDDHSVVRTAIADFIENHTDMEVVGHAVDGKEAVDLARKLHPDIVLMDISLPRLNGIEATRQIRQCCPGTKVIGLSMHNGDTMATTMLSAGAIGYVPKAAPPDDLLSAIRAARAEVIA